MGQSMVPKAKSPRNFQDLVIYNSKSTDEDEEKRKTLSNIAPDAFHSLFSEGMDVEDAEKPSEEFAKLPLVKGKYRVLKILGSGAFGDVLKVQDLSTKELLAMKTISLSMGSEKNSAKANQKKSFIKSAETELDLLPRLRHVNIVRYIDSFLLPRSPTAAAGGSTHLCLLMEYVEGSDLDTLLVFSERNEFELSGICCLKWFVKLLSTVCYFHKAGIVHRDIKPDNILVYYTDIGDVDKMNIKITDFGVGKDVHHTSLNKKEVSGHIFYTSPEVLNKEKCDSLADIWSLGIVFLQVIRGMSLQTYQKKVTDLCQTVKTDPELNKDFCEVHNLKDIYQNVTYSMLLRYLHANGLYEKVLLQSNDNSAETSVLERDEGLRVILDSMICPLSQRLYARQLMRHPIVQTWEFILNEENEIVTDLEILDVRAIFTFLQVVTYETHIFKNCLYCLNLIIEKPAVMQYFIKFSSRESSQRNPNQQSQCALDLLFSKVLPFQKDMFVMTKFFQLCFKIGLRNPEYLRKISIYVRAYYMMDLLKMMIYTIRRNEDLLFFAYLLIKKCNTIRLLFKDSIMPLFLKFSNEFDTIIYYILEDIIPLIDDEKEIEKILTVYQRNNILFFRRCRFEYFDEEENILRDILERVLKRLVVLETESTTSEKEICDNLLMLLFMVAEKAKRVQKISLDLPSSCTENYLQFESKPQQLDENVVINDEGDEFSCISNNSELTSEIISSDPICIFGRDDTVDEKVIGYYEVFVLDGGNNDTMEMGIQIGSNKTLLLQCENGVIQIKDVEKEAEVLMSYTPLFCFSDSYIGFGVTNHGKMFFSKGHRLIRPFFTHESISLEDGDRIHALFRVSGNDFLRSMVNFGQSDFTVQFHNAQKKKEVGSKTKLAMRTILKDMDLTILEKIEKKFNNKVIKVCCKKIVNCAGREYAVINDPTLIKMYEKDDSYRKISETNSEYYFNPIVKKRHPSSSNLKNKLEMKPSSIPKNAMKLSRKDGNRPILRNMDMKRNDNKRKKK